MISISRPTLAEQDVEGIREVAAHFKGAGGAAVAGGAVRGCGSARIASPTCRHGSLPNGKPHSSSTGYGQAVVKRNCLKRWVSCE